MSKKSKKKERKVETENREVENNLESSIPQESLIDSEETTTEEEVVEIKQQLIGDFLREKREEKNLSLKVISQHTKISYTQLENLENNNLDELPNKAYVTGFIKSYCKTISLDQEHALSVLENSYGNFSEETVQEVMQEPTVKSQKSDSNLSIVLVGVALVAIVAGGLIWRSNQPPKGDIAEDTPIKTQRITETTPLSTVSKAETEAEKEPAETEAPAITTKVEPKKEVKVAPVEVKKEEKIVEVKPDKKEKKNDEEKEQQFRALTLPLYTPNNKMTSTEINQLIPASHRNSIVSGKQNVFINATEGDTWITYKADDNPIRKFVLKNGRTLLIRGDLLRVFLGNINVTKVFLNNKPLNIQSRSGVKSLVFPQEKASEFKLPLFIYPKTGKVMTSQEYIQANNN